MRGSASSDATAESAIESRRSRWLEWLFLTGDRRIVALGTTGLVAAFFTCLELLGAVPFEHTQPLFYAYGGLIAGNLTLITVIVSINQLFLSRELQTPGELRTEIENISEYREEVESAAGETAPSTPLGFLRLLVESTRQKAQEVGGFARDGVVTAGSDDIDGVVTDVTRQMDRIEEPLTATGPETFRVLSVMLGTNYAKSIYELREIRREYEDDIAGVAHESIGELVDLLHDVDVSRQYFRSIYLQEELSSLSRVLLYTGFPSVVIATATLAVLTVSPEEPAPVIDLRILLPVTLTVGLLPLAILCSYFFRTATITKLTAATVPFTTPEDARL